MAETTPEANYVHRKLLVDCLPHCVKAHGCQFKHLLFILYLIDKNINRNNKNDCYCIIKINVFY